MRTKRPHTTTAREQLRACDTHTAANPLCNRVGVGLLQQQFVSQQLARARLLALPCCVRWGGGRWDLAELRLTWPANESGRAACRVQLVFLLFISHARMADETLSSGRMVPLRVALVHAPTSADQARDLAAALTKRGVDTLIVNVSLSAAAVLAPVCSVMHVRRCGGRSSKTAGRTRSLKTWRRCAGVTSCSS